MIKKREQESSRQYAVGSMQLLLTAFCLLLTVFAGCGISKDIYQKKVEESEARKASMEQAQEEIDQLKQDVRSAHDLIILVKGSHGMRMDRVVQALVEVVGKSKGA